MNRTELSASLKEWYDRVRVTSRASDMMAVLIAPAVLLAKNLRIPEELFIQGVRATWGAADPEKVEQRNERGPEAALDPGPAAAGGVSKRMYESAESAGPGGGGGQLTCIPTGNGTVASGGNGT